MLKSEVLHKLASFDTPTICNIIELFEVRPRNSGYMNGRITAAFPEMPPIVGYAATATFRADAPPRGNDVYGSMGDQVERFAELDGPAIVVFQDVDDPPVAATFGEVMCSTYQRFGAIGLITSGAGRDLDQVRAINFPVFTGGTICAHGYTHIPQIHVPVRVGGITVYPNDLLHADINGVTTIPHNIAAETADIGDEFVAAETIILDSLRDPNCSLTAFKEARAAAQAKMAQLRAQVSRQHER
jgi:regulator of RNase E activity RraA